MTYAKLVLQATREGREYRADELSVMTQLPLREVVRCLSMLQKGGIIAFTNKSHYIKRRAYQTKQREIGFT